MDGDGCLAVCRSRGEEVVMEIGFGFFYLLFGEERGGRVILLNV